jgi:hypothetical protein
MGEKEVRTLHGWVFKVTNCLARSRDFRRCLFDGEMWWTWIPGDLFIWATHP